MLISIIHTLFFLLSLSVQQAQSRFCSYINENSDLTVQIHPTSNNYHLITDYNFIIYKYTDVRDPLESIGFTFDTSKPVVECHFTTGEIDNENNKEVCSIDGVQTSANITLIPFTDLLTSFTISKSGYYCYDLLLFDSITALPYESYSVTSIPKLNKNSVSYVAWHRRIISDGIMVFVFMIWYFKFYVITPGKNKAIDMSIAYVAYTGSKLNVITSYCVISPRYGPIFGFLAIAGFEFLLVYVAGKKLYLDSEFNFSPRSFHFVLNLGAILRIFDFSLYSGIFDDPVKFSIIDGFIGLNGWQKVGSFIIGLIFVLLSLRLLREVWLNSDIGFDNFRNRLTSDQCCFLMFLVYPLVYISGRLILIWVSSGLPVSVVDDFENYSVCFFNVSWDFICVAFLVLSGYSVNCEKVKNWLGVI